MILNDMTATGTLNRRGLKIYPAIMVSLLVVGLPLLAAAKGPFNFSSEIGSTAYRSDVICLNIHNSGLKSGDRLFLISPVLVQTLAEARVLRRATDACRDTTDTDAGLERYELQVVEGRLVPSMPAIAVHTATKRLSRKGNSIVGDIDADGRIEYFRSCGSAEGLHLTVWSGPPLQGTLRWHHYYYLGYDIKPTCTEREMPK